MFQNIIDPKNAETHPVTSQKGKIILNNYLKQYGGNTVQDNLKRLCQSTPKNISQVKDINQGRSITDLQGIKQDINKYGYAIVNNVVDNNEIQDFHNDVIQYLKDLPRKPGMEIDLRDLTASLDKTQLKKLNERWPLHKTFGAPQELDIFHLHTAWKLRQKPELYNLYSYLLDTKELLANIDRVSIKLPGKGQTEFIHIDRDVHRWDPNPQLQGMIFFSDSTFYAIPKSNTKEFHDKVIEKYEIPPRQKSMTQLPQERDHELLNLEKQLKPISVPKGSLIIWSENLWHASKPNSSKKIRLTLYFGYHRIHPQESPNTIHERLESFNTGKLPPKFPSGGNTSVVPESYLRYPQHMKKYLNIIPQQYHTSRTTQSGKQIPWLDQDKYNDPIKIRNYKPYPLSELGKKLLGETPWNED